MDGSNGVVERAVGEGSNVPAEAAEARYLPQPKAQRRGVALCLSGGGFRAAIFHLGALRRLNELGILSKVDTITSVSGGSIIAGHLANQIRTWPAPGQVFAAWEEAVATPFRAFVGRDLCTGPILQKALPWNWFRKGAQAEALERRYHERLTSLKLSELGDRPEYIFCATDLVFAANWEFSRGRVGDWQAGYAKQPADVTVAAAVAASSCFPPLFEPAGLPVAADRIKGGAFRPQEKRRKLIRGIRLTDGGVYDNMGLEPVWKNSDVVLVSDGGAPFQFVESKMPWHRLKRYVDIASRQGSVLRKRWLIGALIEGAMDGAYWGVASSPQRYHASYSGYSKALAEECISRIRTDMNRFIDAEIAVLENHGYLLAEAAVRRHTPDLAAGQVSPVIPHPEWMDEGRVKLALKDSQKQLTWGRFLELFQR
jgi:NTE family protein